MVYGVGTYSSGKYRARADKESMTFEYDLWTKMLQRCYDAKTKIRLPTYDGCTVSEEFLNFQLFAEWCNNQVGFNIPKMHLDKDLLFKNNKIYSSNTCVFIPQTVNKFLMTSAKYTETYPQGVGWHKASNKFRARFSKEDKSVHLGLFNTPEEASAIYNKAKEAYAKELARTWKDQIDPRAYNTLLTYIF